MIRSLRRKFVLISMLLVTLVLLGIVVGVYLFFTSTQRRDSYRALEQMVDMPGNMPGPHFRLGGNVPEGFRREPMFLVALDPAGAPSLAMQESIEVSEEELLAITQLALEDGAEFGELRDYDLRYVMRTRHGEPKIAFMALSLEKSQARRVMLVTGLAALGAFLVFLAASILLSRWALKPAEIAWQKQRRFIADASHELKTPLTVILANIGILKAHPGSTVDEQMAWVDNSEQEATRMKGLVDDLLFLAKSDDAAKDAPFAPTNLSEVLTQAALSFEPVAFEQGFALETDVESGLCVLGNAAQLRQLSEILLDNALKYGSSENAIRLRAEKQAGWAIFSVRSVGKPILPEEQKHLFDRFYRADAARSEGGVGLGLSIAQSITQQHRGKIAASCHGAESTFTASLPLAKEEGPAN